MEKVLSFDLGGTKLAAAVVTSNGEILEELKEKVDSEKGPDFLLNQMAALGKKLLQNHSEIKKCGIAACGPLHPGKGILVNPTNLKTSGKSWGVVPIAENLSSNLDIPVKLENDAAASILAEQWLGKAKGCENCMILTLGTGLGTGIIANNQLVKAGRGLHPEAGHIILNFTDKSAPSGSGCFGSAEAYLSGKNFSKRFGVKDGYALVKLAKEGDQKALEAFNEYAELLAQAINSYVVLYAPEVIVLAGGFAAATEFYLDKTISHLEELLADRRTYIDMMPKILVSDFKDEVGLLGGARVALL